MSPWADNGKAKAGEDSPALSFAGKEAQKYNEMEEDEEMSYEQYTWELKCDFQQRKSPSE